MTIEVISLKIYWDQERRNIKTKSQILHNNWIDQIFSPASNLSSKAVGYFTIYDFKLAIEYGEYLFVSLNSKNEIRAFAVCVDYPSSNFHLWGHSFSKTHGFCEISILCSKVTGEGAKLLKEIAEFCKITLLRPNIQIDVTKTNEVLIKYYTNLGFSKIKSNYKHLERMKLLLLDV